MKKLEFKIYKHQYGGNLVRTLLRLGKEGFDHIVWDGVNSETDEEWSLLSKGEVNLTDKEISTIFDEGINRNGHTWEMSLSDNKIIIVTGPEEEINLDYDEDDEEIQKM